MTLLPSGTGGSLKLCAPHNKIKLRKEHNTLDDILFFFFVVLSYDKYSLQLIEILEVFYHLTLTFDLEITFK